MHEVITRFERGESQRSISESVEIARATVKNYLDQNEKRRQTGVSAIEREVGPVRAPRPSILDPFEKDLEAWLDPKKYPDLTSVRALEMLKTKGFDGAYTIVRERLREIRARLAPKPIEFEVVSTAPGVQCQFDWSPYKLEGGLEIQLWSCTLSWSRARSMRAHQNQKQSTILNCLQQSFEDFGGVPVQGVTDSMPGVVDRWECDRPILNLRFVDWAAYYRLAMNIAPRAMGRYKGKIERPFWYHEINLLNGRRFYSFEQYVEELAWWVREKAMKRPHPETQRPLWEMLAEERPYLQPLPAVPYDTRDVFVHLVDTQGYVRYETNLYRVKDGHVGELVYVIVGTNAIEVFDGEVHRIAEHGREPDGLGQRVGGSERPRARYDVELLATRLGAWAPAAEEFARRLRAQKRCPGPELNHILGLQLTFSADDIVRALQHAMQYDAYDAGAVERILEARFRPRSLAQQIADSTRARIREVMRDHPVVQRPLSSYETLRRGDPPTGRNPEAESDDEEKLTS